MVENQRNKGVSVLEKFSKTDKILFAYLVILFIFLAYTSSLNSLVSDEGTHLLLSLFYKDMIGNAVSTGDFSFESIYSYSINYLIHYPKLQIAYPPLYHLTNAFFFQLFGPSEMVGKLVNLTYAILAFVVFYFFIKEYFGEKTALIATILFSFSPFTLLYAGRAWLDYTFMFWFLASLYLFSKSVRGNKNIFYILSGLTAGLAFLGKQIGGFLILFYIIAIFLQKEEMIIKFKKMAMLIVAFSLIAVPYILVLNTVGGLEINVAVATFYAQIGEQPTSPINPMYWIYYIISMETIQQVPLLPLLVLGLSYYVWKKQPHAKSMLLFFLVIYLAISSVPTKEPRLSEAFMLPAYVAVGAIISSIKRKIIPVALLIMYCIVSLILFLPSMGYYPTQELVETMMADIPDGSSIALLSDEDPVYSSVIMWYVALNDRDSSHKVYRSCAFDNINTEEAAKLLNDNGVYYAVHSDWSEHQSIELVRNDLTYLFSIDGMKGKTDMYKYNNYSQSTKNCNYICLLGEWVCS